MDDEGPAPRFEIARVDRGLESALLEKIDGKTKPLGALGELEALALRAGLVQGTLEPILSRPALLVFAADHGLTAEGVSAFPSEVTAQMVRNFLAGGAAVNVFARESGFVLEIVDAGVDADLAGAEGLTDRRIARGTRNAARESAMTRAQAHRALAAGAGLVDAHADAGSNVFGFGEMGIGNTSAAALLMSLLCDVPVAECVGAGTGLDDAGVRRKTAVLERTRARAEAAGADRRDAMAVLAECGGFEIAMMAGGMLRAAERRGIVLVDGFIATAALLVARGIAPAIDDYCVFTHRSGERGHARMLEHLRARPLLDLGLRLGEGTGCALAYPLLAAAVAFLRDMASFASAGVSERGDGD